MGGGRRKRRRKESIGRKEREKRKKKEGKKRGEAEREKITRQRRKRKRSYVREEERERRIEGDETIRYDTKRRSPCSRTRTVDENARWGRPRRNREQEQDENGGRVGEVEARARGAADREGEEAAVG